MGSDKAVKKCLLAFCIIVLSISLIGCSSKEAKRDRFYNRGKDLYEKGLYVKAGLELKNAIQLDPEYTDAWFLLGMTEEKQGDLKQAFGIFSKVVGMKPDHVGANIELGKIFLISGMSDKAMEKAEAVLQKEPHNTEALILKADIFLGSGRDDEGISILTGLLAHKVTRPEVYLMLFRNALKNNNLQRAEAFLAEGIRANPKTLELHMTLADFYLRADRKTEAVASLKEVIRLEPEKIIHKLNLASVYVKSERKDEARGIVDKVLNADPGNEENWLAAAFFYQRHGMMQDMEQTLREGVARNVKGVKLRLALSEHYARSGKIDRAVANLKDYLSLAKDDSAEGILQVKNALAALYISKGDLDTAESCVNEALKENTKDSNLHYTKGRICLIKGEAFDAVTELRPVVNKMPHFIPAHLALAEAHRLNNESGLALDTLKNAQKANPRSIEISLAIARFYLSRDDVDSAIKALREIMRQHPGYLEAHGYIGDLYARRGDYNLAEKEYQEILKRDDKNLLGYERLARLHARKGDLKKAILVAEKGYAYNSDAGPALTTLVNLYAQDGKIDMALSVINDRQRKNPNDALAFFLSGRIHAMNKNYKQAEEAISLAIKKAPEWVDPYLLLARIYDMQGKRDEMIRWLEDSIRSKPANPAPYFSLGFLLERGGAYGKARQVYESGVARFPDLWPFNNNLAFLISETSRSRTDLNRALALAKKAKAIRPDDAAVNDTLGWVYYRTGELEKALKYVSMAFEQDPLNPIFNYHLGVIMFQKGDQAKARERLEAALKSPEDYPGRGDAQRTMASIKGVH